MVGWCLGWGDIPKRRANLNAMQDSKYLTRRTLLGGTLGATLSLSQPVYAKAFKPRKRRAIIDGLSFLPTNLTEVVSSGLTGMICDVSEVAEIKDAQGFPRYLRTNAANEKALADAVRRIANSDQVYLATKGSDLGKRPGCAAFLQFQSCETLDEDLSKVSSFKEKGLSILQLTHHNDNAVAGGAIEPVQSGLTPFGRDVIREMNRVKLLPDVSHGSAATIIEAAELSRSPILYSHGACRAIVDHPRCIDDAGIRAIAKRGGAVGIFMMSFWLTRDPVPTVDHLIAQLRHVIRIGGIESVGISNDFPVAGQENLIKLGNDNAEGVKEYLAWWKAMHARGVPGFATLPQHVVIPALNRIDRLDRIQSALHKARFKPREIDKIMGENWRRILIDVLG
jgi:membrane dipeptidase